MCKLNTLHVDMDRWETFVKTTTSESGASRVVVDVDGTLGAALMEVVSTDVSATVSGPSFLSPSLGDHDYESIDSELPEEVRLPKNVF